MVFRAGAKYDRADQAGVAYFSHELLMNESLSERFNRSGAKSLNYQTGGSIAHFINKDVSVYKHLVQSNEIESIFEIEASRLKGSNFDNERMVEWRNAIVKDETLKNHHLTDFENKLKTRLYTSAMVSPVTGYADYLESATIDEIKRFIQKYYSSDRAILVVAGNVLPDSIFALARKQFGFWRANRNSFINTGAQLDSVYRKEFALLLPDGYPNECMLNAYTLKARDSSGMDYYQYRSVAHLLFDREKGIFHKKYNENDELLLKSGLEIDFLAEGGYIKHYMFPRKGVSLDSIQVLIDTLLASPSLDSLEEAAITKWNKKQQINFLDGLSKAEWINEKMIYSFLKYGDCKTGLLREWKAYNLSVKEITDIIKSYFSSQDNLTVQLLTSSG